MKEAPPPGVLRDSKNVITKNFDAMSMDGFLFFGLSFEPSPIRKACVP